METFAVIRNRRRITQQRLAETLGTTQAYISKVENGQTVMSEKMATKAAHVLAVPATRVLASQRKLRDVRTAVKQLQDARLTAPEEITTAVKSLARVAGDRSLPPDLRDSARKSVEALTGAVLKASGFAQTTPEQPRAQGGLMDPAYDVRGLPVAEDGDGNYWVLDPQTFEPVGPISGDVVEQMGTPYGEEVEKSAPRRDALGRKRMAHAGGRRDGLGRARP